MSTGAGCRFTQTGPDEWQYELQRYPYGETREYNEYGPFTTFDEAHKHLQRNHANPGGFMIRRLEGYECDHDWMQDGCFEECLKCGRQK